MGPHDTAVFVGQEQPNSGGFIGFNLTQVKGVEHCLINSKHRACKLDSVLLLSFSSSVSLYVLMNCV